jgi:hypothetical protein
MEDMISSETIGLQQTRDIVSQKVWLFVRSDCFMLNYFRARLKMNDVIQIYLWSSVDILIWL